MVRGWTSQVYEGLCTYCTYCINNLAPRYMSDMFTISVTYCRVTRASNGQDLYLPGGKYKVLYTDSFAYSGVIIWNNLSPSICNCSNPNQFKSAYLNDYFR